MSVSPKKSDKRTRTAAATVKQYLPVSSRSFHRNETYLQRQAESVQDGLAQIRADLTDIRSTMEYQARIRRESKAFYLLAEPGFPNYGDELIAREWVNYLAMARPETQVVLDCSRPGPAAAEFMGIHPHLTVTDTISRLSLESPADDQNDVTQIAPFIRETLNDEGKAARYCAGIRIVRDRIRSFHVLGGGYINNKWQANMARLEAGAWCEQHGITAIATGLGLLPSDEHTTQYLQNTLPHFSSVTVRDQESLSLLANPDISVIHNVRLMPDDCFVNGLDGCYNEQSGLPRFMVCVQTDQVEHPKELLSHVVRILERWNVSRDEEIGVVECIPYGDRPIYDYLHELGYTVRFFSLIDLLTDGLPANPDQTWISTRYHPHLIAAAIGARGVFVPIDSSYYNVKHQAVLRMGSRWNAAVPGQEIPQSGEGFEDLDLRYRYRDQIRKSVRVAYGA